MNAAFHRRLLLLILSLWMIGPAGAATLEQLRAVGELQLESRLRPDTDLVPGQKATLTFRISTNRWFAGGTRISIPEVPGLVILQTEQFASNASENRGGESWVVQRWNLDVYAQRAGEFTIPPVKLTLKVNTADAGNVEGDLFSDPVTFTASLPAGLEKAEHWVASPEFSVSQSFDRLPEDLQVGDALEQEIRFEASDVMAMMLPPVEVQRQPGLAAYPSPPELKNESNRGQLTARRIERINWVVEAEGSFRIPAREFFWWDTRNARLQLLSLPETTFTVGEGGSAGKSGGTPPWRLLAALAGLALITLLLWLARKLLARLPIEPVLIRCRALLELLRSLRRPALPERLNPGSSAGD